MAKRKRKDKRRSPESKGRASTKALHRRYWIAAGVVAALSLLVAFSLWSRGERRGWPEQFATGSAANFNVLVITLDTTRADRLGCYGYAAAQTPVLDALAADGIRFDDAVTVVPVTLPAHATIFTGLYPPNHGVRNNGEFRLAPEHATLAEVLRNQGYQTAAFVSAFVLDARFGLDRGFELYDDNVSVAASSTVAAFAKHIYERPAAAVTSAAIGGLKERDRDRPFFFWAHYFDPHSPHAPPPPFATRFRDRPYDGEIAYVDAQIGRLMQALDAEGVRDNTLIFVVGDHGESLGDHDEPTHSKLIYESTMHVPLIVACPGLFRGPYVVDDRVVSIADIFPTIVELLGIEGSKACDGLSLSGVAATGDRMVYLETLAPYLDNGWSPLYGLRRHLDKYILAPRPEYYDLNSDPNELSNLHAQVTGAAMAARDTLAAALSSRLAEWPTIAGVVASAQPLDPESIRRLESLGYVGTISGADVNDQLADPKDMMPVMRAVDRARGLGSAGRHGEALKVIKQAAILSPNDPNVLLTMGKTYLFLNRLEEAEQTFRAANALRPATDLCIFLAQIMLADGRLDGAEELLDQAETLEPLHGGIFLARGDLFALRRRPDEAIAAYEHAGEVDPYRASAEAQSRITRLREIMRAVQTP